MRHKISSNTQLSLFHKMRQYILDRIENHFEIIILPKWRSSSYEEANYLRKLFRFLDVDCVLDVGANVGQYGHMVRHYSEFRGRIISFEPNPGAFRELATRAARDLNWLVEQLALGRTQGMETLYVHPANDMSSLHKIDPGSLSGTSIKAPLIEETVPVNTLSCYLSETKCLMKYSRPFLKIDTQGSDLDVLSGAESHIQYFAGIQTELSFNSIYQNTPSYIEHIKYLEERGFVLTRLINIHDSYFPHLIEMNAFFVRQDLTKNY